MKSIPPLLGIPLILFLTMGSAPAAADGGRYAVTDLPAAVRVVLERAERLAGKGQFAEAAASLETFRGRHHFLVDFYLGNYRIAAGQTAAALAAYEQAVEKGPAFAPAWFNLAKAAYDLKQYEKAAHGFLRSYETDPDGRPERLYYAGAALMAAQRPDRALAVMRRLADLCDGDLEPAWREAMVSLLLEAKAPREAVTHMEILCRETTGTRRRQWQETLLHHYMAMEMNAEALTLVRGLIREQPGEPRWWKGLAHLHLSQGREKEALSAMIIHGFLTPPPVDGTPVDEKRLTADLYLSLGVPASAATLYREIASEKPDPDPDPDPDLIKRLIHATRWIKAHDEALAWAVKGFEISGDLEFRLIQGDLHYEAEQYTDALAAYRSAAGDERYAGRAWLMAAYCAWYDGDIKTAQKAVAHAVRFKAQKKSALELQARLRQEAAP